MKRILNAAFDGIVENISWLLLVGLLTVLGVVARLPFAISDPATCLVVVVSLAIILLAVFGAILFAIIRDQPWMLWLGMYAFLRNGLTFRDIDRLSSHSEKMYLAFARKSKKDRDIDSKIESLLWQNVLNCDVIRELAEARGELNDTFGSSKHRVDSQNRALQHLCVNHAGRLKELFPDEPMQTLHLVSTGDAEIPEEVRVHAERLLKLYESSSQQKAPKSQNQK